MEFSGSPAPERSGATCTDISANEGFDVKILKEVIRLRKQDQNERDERDSLLDLYFHAIETAPPLKAQAAE